ncbi:C-type lectin domain family 4 member C [Elysia marginata]|uniref:C-type lectin domain family 4 member C n=1 Tax=Elysia marginata TaxID=1093978 RepID=A0AAV4GA20_9GAST|nr:C-type lectin domain family 4 member C [Elysia marginata]
MSRIKYFVSIFCTARERYENITLRAVYILLCLDLCPVGWLPSEASGTCLKVFNVRETWTDARRQCLKHGADLVVIVNAEMNDFIHEQLHLGFPYIIGLNQRQPDLKWQWLDNAEEVGYTLWDEGQPSGAVEKNCTIINRRNLKIRESWRSADCKEKFRYICEKSSDCRNVKFGMICIWTCGLTNCSKKACNRKTGACLEGCEPGHTGLACDKAKQPVDKALFHSFRNWLIHGFFVAAAFLLAFTLAVLLPT